MTSHKYMEMDASMEIIELRPQYLRMAGRIFFTTFTVFFIVKLMEFGWFERSEVWLVLRARAIEALVGTGAYFFGMAIFQPFGQLIVVLTETTLQAPVKRGIKWKSMTVELAEICLSRHWKDRVHGTQLATRDGLILRIYPSFYTSGAVTKLFDEIERRQEAIKSI